jgi:hypothetical protein
MAESGNALAPLIKSCASLSNEPAHFTAATNSGTRMRPSPSESISSRVLLSNSSP